MVIDVWQKLLLFDTELFFNAVILMAVSTKMAVFWVVALCSLVEIYQRFIFTVILILRSFMQVFITGTSVSEMLCVSKHTTTLCTALLSFLCYITW
jgi:hypothetical protein